MLALPASERHTHHYLFRDPHGDTTNEFQVVRRIRLLRLALKGLPVTSSRAAVLNVYAALYVQLGATSGFEESLYFSTVTYASIGYGDVLLPHAGRILGAIEGATGVIMLGWSTAFLVSLLARFNMFRHDWLTPDGAE